MPAMYGVAADTTGVHHQLAFIPKNCHTGIIVMLEKLSYWVALVQRTGYIRR
jgi:hypothetical protein